ncbi:MAG TPA: DAK2 domain-containing protein [Actinophytocola sp.]|jgi:dihydroxyacetone kinase-like predicted kinase|nr:DAK2 domain-containing protein [Actinophytocola sp.]
MLRALDAAHVRRWAVACVQSLDAHREAIDRMNVYPVADSDTGSNLLHTMRAALDALLRAPAPARTDASAALAALAHGALTGARGNSGVIISQMLRGAADALSDAHADHAHAAAAVPARATVGGGGAGGPAARAAAGRAGGGVDGGASGTAATGPARPGSVPAAGEILSGPGASALPPGAAGRSAGVEPGATVIDSGAEQDNGRVVTGRLLKDVFVRGAERAGRALADPVPGTMISVLEAAAAAADAEASDELGDVIAAAAAGAAAALEETPRQLAVLAEAGVVDAGGRGVVVVLDALAAVIGEQPAALAAALRARTERVAAPAETSMYTARESGSDAFAYEVMYLLDGVNGNGDPIGRLRDTLVGLGDCVSVVGDGAGLWTVHVHCNDIGAAIEAGVEAARPRQIRVARFADAPSAEASRFVKDRAVVVPARSTELADLLISEGVTVVHIEHEPDDDVAHRLLEAITGTEAAHVTVLSADSTLIEVSDEASIRAVAAGQDVVVVPCASPVQVLAAVAVHDPRRRASDDVVAMAEAAAATRRGEVMVSAEAAITWIGACDAGDVLGFADGEVVLIEPGPPGVDALDRAACGVVERMLGMGGELVTALLGADAPDELAGELGDYLRRQHPETELVVYHGGQTDAVLILGVE